MNDTEVISWMHHLAVSADSDVLADDLHSLANSFDAYRTNGAIDDEIEELEEYYGSDSDGAATMDDVLTFIKENEPVDQEVVVAKFDDSDVHDYLKELMRLNKISHNLEWKLVAEEDTYVMGKHDVYSWLADELEQRGVSDVHSVISPVYFPLDYLDEKPPAIYVQESVVKEVDMPQSPDGWEWKRYTNTREPNYLVKTGDDSSDRRLNPLSAINNDPDIETYNEALIWLKEQFGSRREYGHTTLYDPPGGFRDAVYVEGVDIDDWPASPDGWKWNVAIEMDNKLYLMKKVKEVNERD